MLVIFQKEAISKLETEFENRAKSVSEREKKIKEIDKELEKSSEDGGVSKIAMIYNFIIRCHTYIFYMKWLY